MLHIGASGHARIAGGIGTVEHLFGREEKVPARDVGKIRHGVDKPYDAAFTYTRTVRNIRPLTPAVEIRPAV